MSTAFIDTIRTLSTHVNDLELALKREREACAEKADIIRQLQLQLQLQSASTTVAVAPHTKSSSSSTTTTTTTTTNQNWSEDSRNGTWDWHGRKIVVNLPSSRSGRIFQLRNDTGTKIQTPFVVNSVVKQTESKSESKEETKAQQQQQQQQDQSGQDRSGSGAPPPSYQSWMTDHFSKLQPVKLTQKDETFGDVAAEEEEEEEEEDIVNEESEGNKKNEVDPTSTPAMTNEELLEQGGVMEAMKEGDMDQPEPRWTVVNGSWTEIQSGGPMNSANPQFTISFPDRGHHRAEITLSRKKSNKRCGMIFYVFDAGLPGAKDMLSGGGGGDGDRTNDRDEDEDDDSTHRMWFGYPDDAADDIRLSPKYKSKASRGRKTTFKGSFRGGGRKYIVVPCMEKADNVGKFQLTVNGIPVSSSASSGDEVSAPVVTKNVDLLCHKKMDGQWRGLGASRLQSFADSSNPSASAPHIYNPQFRMTVKKNSSGFVLLTVRCSKSLSKNACIHLFVYKAPLNNSRSNLRRCTFPSSSLVACQDGFMSGNSVTVAANVGKKGGKFIVCCCIQEEESEGDEGGGGGDYEYDSPPLKEGSFVLHAIGQEEETIKLSSQLEEPEIHEYNEDETDTIDCDSLLSKLRNARMAGGVGNGPIDKLDWNFLTLSEDPLKDILNKQVGDQKFVDQDFPPTQRSVNLDLNDTQLHYDRWVRLSEICDEPTIFRDGVDADDVLQGSLGNCWFMGAISAIAWARPECIRGMFSPVLNLPKYLKKCLTAGCFSIKILDLMSNEERWIVVDDYIPVDGNLRPVFSRGRDPNEIWAILLEKCFAKLHGSYQSMAGHSRFCLKIGPGIHCLTGAKVDLVEPKAMRESQLWERLLQAKKERSIMECSTRNDPSTQKMGLVCYHAYSVVGLSELKNGTKLLKIRNTWGHGEWEGAWRDTDPRWTDSVKRQVDNFVDSDDGSFHIELKDFAVHYNRLYFASLENQNRNDKEQKFSSTTKGYWLPPFAGGTTANNPQFYVAFGKGTDNKKIELKLKIPEAQYSQDGGQHRLVLLVCGISTKRGEITRVKHLSDIIKQSHAVANRQATLTLSLSASVKGFVVIPCWDNGTEGNTEFDKGSFKLTVESTANFGVQTLSAENYPRRGSARSIDRDLGRANVVPAELTGGQSTFESLKNSVAEKVEENCTIS